MMELLRQQEYDITGYDNFSISEIDAMINTSQLDFLVSKTDPNKGEERKLYVKYFLDSKQLRPGILDEVIEELFYDDETPVLTKKDTLVFIVDSEPNETITAKMEFLFKKDGIFVIFFNLKRLQFNILKHALVPPARILTTFERETFFREYNVKDLSQIPEISRFDPQAQAMFMRPGDICRIERSSLTALKYNYYRVCV